MVAIQHSTPLYTHFFCREIDIKKHIYKHGHAWKSSKNKNKNHTEKEKEKEKELKEKLTNLAQGTRKLNWVFFLSLNLYIYESLFFRQPLQLTVRVDSDWCLCCVSMSIVTFIYSTKKNINNNERKMVGPIVLTESSV